MEQSYLDLVQLLRAFVKSERPQFPDEIDWNSVCHLADINSVLGIVAYVTMRFPGLAEEKLSRVMHRVCLQTAAQFSQRAERMRQLMKAFNDRGIDHLVFKGFVVRDYYPVPELRSFGDIDFVIRAEDRKRVDDFMLEMGFTRECEYEPAYSYLRGTEYYEIHTAVLEVDVSDKADYMGYFKRIWDYALCVRDHTYEFKPEFHFLYILTHLAKHISSSGAGIRMYLDVAFFVLHFGRNLDWEWVQGELETLKLTDFANMVFNAVEQWFGVGSPIPMRPVDDSLMDDFLSFTLEGGTFGHVGRDSGMVFLKNQDRNDVAEVSRPATMIHRLFPPAKEIENRYVYLQGRGWLLPIAWVHRFFRGAERFGYHVNQAKEIMNAENDEVLKLRRIYKEIGL